MHFLILWLCISFSFLRFLNFPCFLWKLSSFREYFLSIEQWTKPRLLGQGLTSQLCRDYFISIHKPYQDFIKCQQMFHSRKLTWKSEKDLICIIGVTSSFKRLFFPLSCYFSGCRFPQPLVHHLHQHSGITGQDRSQLAGPLDPRQGRLALPADTALPLDFTHLLLSWTFKVWKSSAKGKKTSYK